MYYQGKVKIKFENENGKVQTINEVYLIEATSVGDGEAKLHKEMEGENDFEVIGVSKTKILKVL